MSQKNKVKFNLKNVHYAMLELDAQGVPTFAAPVPIPGAVSISLDANGEPENFYADGYAYYVINNNMGYEGDLEVALIPESFRVDALKEKRDANGVLIEDANTGLGRFALLFEFDGDKRHVRHVMYNCAASRPNIEGQTNEESKEVQTETLTLNVSPLPDGRVKAKTGDITSDAVYNAWYDAVYISSAGAGDATLSALTIGSLTLSPTFDEDVTEYTATATNAADAVTATATEDGAGVVVVVNGNSIGNGEDATWETGENTVAITVTSGEVSRTYTVTVTKE